MLTLAIIKPDAVQAGHTGKILAHLEAAGFQIRAVRLVRLSTAQAQAFYAVHRDRPFFKPLVAFMALQAGRPCRLRGCGRPHLIGGVTRRNPVPAGTGLTYH